MEKSQRRVKFRRTTQEQLDYYTDFCRRHPEFLAGRNSSQSPAVLQKLWQTLTENLNSLKGPVRTPAKWKESLAVWKSQLRARARKKRSEHLANAGGPQTTRQEFEELALSTFGSSGSRGLKEIAPKEIVKTEAEDNESFSAADEFIIKGDQSPGRSSPEYVGPKSPGAESHRSNSPTMSVGVKEISRDDMFDVILRSIEQRDARELELIQAQLATAQALERIGVALSSLADAIKKLNK